MRMLSTRSHELVHKNASGNASPLYLQKSDQQSSGYCYSPSPQTSTSTPTDLRYSLNGLQYEVRSESRKSVRFSDHIGCKHIPCTHTPDSLVERISEKLKFLRTSRISTVVFDDASNSRSSGLLCLPRMSRRRRSVSPLEAAVWNSGQQLRQYVPSPTIFKRLSDFPAHFLRGHNSDSFEKWRSQPSLKSALQPQRSQKAADLDSTFDRMESVYVSDSEEDYEWGSTPNEWEDYENPLSILPQRSKVTQVNQYASTNSCGPDADYEFDEYATPKLDLLHILKAHQCTHCRSADGSSVGSRSSDEKLPDLPDVSMKTPLQDRVAQSLSRLSIPEWMQKKVGGNGGTKSSKPSSRIPRFPRYLQLNSLPEEEAVISTAS